MEHLYLVDFDRTLFNTSQFAEQLIAAMAGTYHLDPGQFRSQMQSYSLPGEIGYSFFDHAEAVTGKPKGTIESQIAPQLGNDYSYPDAAPWISSLVGHDILVVTVGEPSYQAFKFGHAPALKNLRKEIVGENKGKLIRQALAGKTSSLQLDRARYSKFTVIDDNPRTFEELGLIDNVECIYISRPGERFSDQPVPSHARQITSLSELS